MTPTVRLGRLFGIEIGFNWSLIFVFALISWSLASTVLPQAVPNQSAGAYWLTAVVGAVVFYGCLLAHELSHALVARRNGVQVAGITLWLFGGVSKLAGEPRSAGIEALISAVGPLTSLLVAVLAFALAALGSAVGAPALATTLLGWLALLNLGLGLFNLVPAFPLDGGRLLSSFFWWRAGSRPRGVHAAVQVGRVFAFLMIAAGALELFRGDAFNGIWIAFIGWFLLSAAGAEDTSTVTRALLESVPVSAAMSSPVVTVPDWLTIEQFLASEALHDRFTTYPLHAPSGDLTGVVRLGEIVREASRGGRDKRLRDLAVPLSQMPTSEPQENLEALLERLGPRLARRVLVFDNGKLVGILSPNDVARIVAVRQALGSRQPVLTK
jgi:Zn-dependent protease/predicted transcriptional regulator